MRCASCGSENPERARFCIECGSSLQSRCPSCGGENLAPAKFCAACGTALSSGGKPASAQRGKGKGEQTPKRAPRPQGRSTPKKPQVAAREAERRQLTVMFCDLVGSTALSQQLDPEELREVVQYYQETCTEVIRRYEGHIAQHLGDGLLIYFGYPVAHEDDAVRAVRTGLEIIQALGIQTPRDGRPEKQEPLRVRIGIHTGLVVVGEMGRSEKREILALGETPNLAARIQGQANLDEVLVSAATYRLVEGLFDMEDRGQPELKGVTVPLTLYRVEKESEAHSRFAVVVRKGLTPLIGREHEFGLLRERWARVKDGAGQVVLLCGEPGIGKSRVVEALKETIEHEGARCLELRCSPYAQNSALHPLIEHLQRALQFRPEDSPDEKLHKLIVGATGRSSLQTEVVALLAALLSLPHPEGYAPLTLSPQKQKEKTYDALVAWLSAEAQQQAVTYAWEDLHWADPSTLELLAFFFNQVPTTRLLVVLTFRPEFTAPWGAHSYLSQLTLGRLGRNHVEVMVEKVTGGTAFPKEIVQQIVNKTDGVPLFVEELTKSVVESVGAHGRASLHLGIPATLQDALMARLDRLGTAKEIAQLGATLGREFTYELLTVVSPLAEEILQQGLKQLIDAELVYQRGLPPHATYVFKHALVQDTAYQVLLKSRRQQLHQLVAQVLVEQFPQTVETQPELLAHHYTAAGLIAQAIPFWQQAGQRASQRSANVEALRHFTKGLALLTTLPDTPERAQQELTLQLFLHAPLIAVKGYASLEVGKVVTRARALCQQLGETPQLFSVLVALSLFYLNRAEFRTAQELAEQLFRIAQRAQDPTIFMWAHARLGTTLYWLGESASAENHFEQSLALYDPQHHCSQAFLYGQDPQVAVLSYRAWNLWILGYPDRALASAQAALSRARELSHSHTLAWALNFIAFVHVLRRDWHAAQEGAERVLKFCTEQGFRFWLPFGTVLRGWGLAEQGQGGEGIAQMRQVIPPARPWTREGGAAIVVNFIALLAEVYGKMGQTEEGLSVLAEASVIVDQTDARWWKAELYRLKGTLTLESKVQGSQSQVEAETESYFHKAIEVARKQQAKSFELRAATSLARLWQRQGKQYEAHKLLSDVYTWFTEGFDTKDLQEAKALLEELAEG